MIPCPLSLPIVCSQNRQLPFSYRSSVCSRFPIESTSGSEVKFKPADAAPIVQRRETAPSMPALPQPTMQMPAAVKEISHWSGRSITGTVIEKSRIRFLLDNGETVTTEGGDVKSYQNHKLTMQDGAVLYWATKKDK